MAELILHGRNVGSVFELLGTKENDITYSVGWAMSRCPSFLAALVGSVAPGTVLQEDVEVRLQEHHSVVGGFTDIELRGSGLHLILEAKRGPWLPGEDQLVKYAQRFDAASAKRTGLVAMSESGPAFASVQLPEEVMGHRVKHLSWMEVGQLCSVKTSSHAERRLLIELRNYIESFVMLQNKTTNMVYVVTLAHDTPEWSSIAWRDIVNVRRTYFHPVGLRGFPKDPVNYVAFRYDGRLQSIHHVDSWRIAKDRSEAMPELAPGDWGPHFVYSLGEPIVPAKIVKTGSIFRNGRVWAMIDLLLTCDTISEARDRTKARLGGLGAELENQDGED